MKSLNIKVILCVFLGFLLKAWKTGIRTVKRFFRVDEKPNRKIAFVLSISLFVLFLVLYMGAAHFRHLDNPQEKVTPTISQMFDAFKRVAFEPDRKGEFRLLKDTLISAFRFCVGIAIAFLAVLVGLHMGVFPYTESLMIRFGFFTDKIAALALLAILFIIFGIGETAKIALIVIGVFPTVMLDTYLRAKALPREQITKAQTLGANDWEIAYRVVLPQIFPKALDTIRLNFKMAIACLIAGEAIAAEAGLGFRIFLVRRFIAMDIIIVYVLWIAALTFLADRLFYWGIKRYTWLDKI